MAPGDPTPDPENGYRYVLPKRPHPFQRFVTSRCTVEATPRELRVFDSFGPFKRDWSSPWDRDTQFRLELTGVSSSDIWGLRVETGNEAVLVGAGYPKAKLQELEANLRAARMEWMGSEGSPADPPRTQAPTLAPTHEPAAPAPPVPAQFPPGKAPHTEPFSTESTLLHIQESPHGVQVTVPPVGLGKGTHGLVVFALAFVGIPLPFLLLGAVQTLFSEGLGALLTTLPEILGFGALSAALLLPVWNVGKRSAVLTVDAENLRITRKSIFGVQTFCYPRGDVTNVRIGDSLLQVNGKFIQELQVEVNRLQVVRMMTQRTNEEIQRTARALLAALRKPPNNS
jgi:hypothetical protein